MGPLPLVGSYNTSSLFGGSVVLPLKVTARLLSRSFVDLFGHCVSGGIGVQLLGYTVPVGPVSWILVQVSIRVTYSYIIIMLC